MQSQCTVLKVHETAPIIRHKKKTLIHKGKKTCTDSYLYMIDNLYLSRLFLSFSENKYELKDFSLINGLHSSKLSENQTKNENGEYILVDNLTLFFLEKLKNVICWQFLFVCYQHFLCL